MSNDPQFDMRQRVRSVIAHYVIDTYGRDEGTENVPMFEGSNFREDRPKARYTLEAARRIEQAARAAAYRAVEAMRAEGADWSAVAAVVRGTEQADYDAATEVFEEYTGGGNSLYEPRLIWRCHSCKQVVSDHGPYSNHPADIEENHAEDCERHRADIRRYRESIDWDDEED